MTQGPRKKIFHLPFAISHFPFLICLALLDQFSYERSLRKNHWASMKNGKWQMINGKSSFAASADCLLPTVSFASLIDLLVILQPSLPRLMTPGFPAFQRSQRVAFLEGGALCSNLPKIKQL